MKKILAKNFYWIAIDKLYKNILNVSIGIWAARQIGPDQFGYYGLSLTIYGIITVIISFGFEHNLSVALSKMSDKKQLIAHVSHIINFKKKLSVLIGLVYLISVAFIINDVKIYYLLSVITISAYFISNETIEYYYQALFLNQIYIKIRLYIYTISSLIKLILLSWKPDVSLLVTTYVIEIVVLNLFLEKKFKSEEKIEKNENKPCIKYYENLKYMIGSLLTVFYMKLDVLYVSRYFDARDMGVYIAAANIINVTFIIPAMANTIFIPYMARVTNNYERKNILKKILFIYLMVALVFFIIFTFFSRSIINITYGDKFMGAVDLIKIYGMAVIICYIGIYNSMIISLKSRPNLNILRAIAGLLTMCLTINYFEGRFGIVGVVYATLLGYFISDIVVPVVKLYGRSNAK